MPTGGEAVAGGGRERPARGGPPLRAAVLAVCVGLLAHAPGASAAPSADASAEPRAGASAPPATDSAAAPSLGAPAASPAGSAAPPPAYGPRPAGPGPCRDVPWPLPTDGALCDAAGAIAEAALGAGLSADPAARAREVTFLLRRSGVADAHVRPLVLRGRGHGDLLARLMSAAADRGDATHLGVALRGSDETRVGVLLLARRLVRLDGLPALARPGETLVIRGELAPGVGRPSVLVGRPDGGVDALPVELTGRRLRAVAAPGEGTHLVEVVVETKAGPEAAVLAPVHVGVPPPTAPAPPLTDAAGDPVAAIHQAVVDLRRAAGLPSVVRDPRLDALARRRAEDAAARGRPVHRAGGGDAESRLAAAGYGFAWAGEDLAVGPGALAAFDGLLESPAHRRLLVDRRARRAGVGLQRTGDRVYLALLLVEPQAGEQADGVPGAGRVVEAEILNAAELAIRAERRRSRLRPVPRDPDLDALAREHAIHLARLDAPSDPAAARAVEDRALALDPEAHAASMEIVVAGRPEAAVRAPGVLDPGCARMGLGVARAASRRYNGERLWIAALCTHRGGP